MGEIEISVICITYNHERYIRECLDNILNQKTSFEYEVIVHDDASTDSTQSIIMEYAKKYPEIVKPYLEKENQYSKGTDLNRLWKDKVRGKYIAECEGDDYWCDDQKLQMEYEFLESHEEYSACTHNTYVEDSLEKKNKIMYSREKDCDLDIRDVIFWGDNSFHFSSVLYRTSLIQDIPNFVEPINGAGDFPKGVYFCIKGKVRYINRVMSVYRRGAVKSSWTRSVMHNKKNIIQLYWGMASYLYRVNEYLDFLYSTDFDRAIFEFKYKALELSGDYSKLRREPYIEIYNRHSKWYKIKSYLKQILKL